MLAAWTGAEMIQALTCSMRTSACLAGLHRELSTSTTAWAPLAPCGARAAAARAQRSYLECVAILRDGLARGRRGG